MRPFGEAQSKATRAYTKNRQYHTIVDIVKSIDLQWYEAFWGNPKQNHESLY